MEVWHLSPPNEIFTKFRLSVKFNGYICFHRTWCLLSIWHYWSFPPWNSILNFSSPSLTTLFQFPPVGQPLILGGLEQEYKWKPTFYMSKYFKVINQANKMLNYYILSFKLILHALTNNLIRSSVHFVETKDLGTTSYTKGCSTLCNDSYPQYRWL